ncbi:hypothetical protein [Couchioplanes caeruleus]|nr:hypothetical protein [Couchioplanes caeruleus]
MGGAALVGLPLGFALGGEALGAVAVDGFLTLQVQVPIGLDGGLS